LVLVFEGERRTAFQLEALEFVALRAEKAVAGEVVFAELAKRLKGAREGIQGEPYAFRNHECAVSASAPG